MSSITSAIGGLVGDLTGSSQQASAAQNAAQTQANAANYAADLQNKAFQQTQSNLSPYMNIGTQALPQYLSLLGLGSQGAAGMQSQLQNMPGYQFALQQGLKSAANSASGSGLNLSGAQQKGLANYSTGLASQTYNSLLSNLASAVGTGQNAAAGLGSAGMNTATSVGNNLTAGANSTAAGQIAAGNAQSNALSSLMGLGQGASGIYALANYKQPGGTSFAGSLGNMFSGASKGISGLFGGGGAAGSGSFVPDATAMSTDDVLAMIAAM